MGSDGLAILPRSWLTWDAQAPNPTNIQMLRTIGFVTRQDLRQQRG